MKILQFFIVGLAFFVSGQTGVNAALASGVDITISGNKNTLIEPSLISFDLALFKFVSASSPAPKNFVKIETRGNASIMDLVITGNSIDDTFKPLMIEGVFGQTETEAGKLKLVNFWWEYNFTIQLNNRSASEDGSMRLDEVSVTNGIIKHDEGPHPGDDLAGLNVIWGDLAIIANAKKVGPNMIRRNMLTPPLGCESHPGTANHSDCITEGTLSGKVIDNLTSDDFESWRLVARARHKSEPCTHKTVSFLISHQNYVCEIGDKQLSNISFTGDIPSDAELEFTGTDLDYFLQIGDLNPSPSGPRSITMRYDVAILDLDNYFEKVKLSVNGNFTASKTVQSDTGSTLCSLLASQLNPQSYCIVPGRETFLRITDTVSVPWSAESAQLKSGFRQQVPGPIGVLGVVSIFRLSRLLRKRIKT